MTSANINDLVILRPGLSHCPFCGCSSVKGVDIYRDKKGEHQKAYSVICESNKCNATIPGNTFEEAKDKWNARV